MLATFFAVFQRGSVRISFLPEWHKGALLRLLTHVHEQNVKIQNV